MRWLAMQRPEAEAGRDLDEALGLLGLFRVAFATGTVDPEARSAHQVLGLLAQPSEPGRAK